MSGRTNGRHLLAAAFGAALLAGATGCAWLGGYDADGRPLAKHFTVDISNLDWVEISYMPRPDDPAFSSGCRLSLAGSGEIEFRTGRSPQVWDDFSSKVDDPHWNEVFADRLHVGQDGMQEIYQQLVDAGLFVRRSAGRRRDDMVAPFVKLNARIGRERAIRVVSDRRLVRIVERVLANFEQTALLARRAEGRR